MWILDPDADDVQALDDGQLVELVKRLCHREAEVLGLPSTAVTQGGKDAEGDGGIDVRVEGRQAAAGPLLRLPVGIQVKARKMGRADIITEMQPGGVLRPSILTLLKAGGVYIIASGRNDLVDSRRSQLVDVMRDQVPPEHREQVHFYDSQQLVRWSSAHPGIAAWLRAQAGRPFDGWAPWGSWSAPDQPDDLPYLLDTEARVCQPTLDPDRAHLITTGLGLLREALGCAQAIARLTGLSGMGKTRFAQVVFDDRVGAGALDPGLAIYGDAGFGKSVSPGQLARSLVEDQVEAVLIVDNCPTALHHELSTIVRSRGSRLRLLTIDFDVGDHQPDDRTEVFRLQNAGEDLIDSLLLQRAPDLSLADRRAIVRFAGGNTRIALAIAMAPAGRTGIAHLRNEQLLDRLFLRERRDPDADLRRVARVAALVNAFSVTGDEAPEAEALRALTGVSTLVFHEKLAELLDRGLAQQRGDQRSILPQAIAAWLAAEALKSLPDEALMDAFGGFSLRLQVSFARRLGTLQGTPAATALAERLLSPGGRFASPLDDSGLEMRAVRFLAPLAPRLALDVAERQIARGVGMESWRAERRELRQLLLGLAYDPVWFDRAVELLAILAAPESTDQRPYESVREKILPLFQVQWSGTHASPDQRLATIDGWLASGDANRRALGLDTLDQMLETRVSGADPHLEFGAEPRDSGWHPKTLCQLRDWYVQALARVCGLLDTDGETGRRMIAKRYPALVAYPVVVPAAVAAMRAAGTGPYWPKGWFAACDAIWRLRKKKRSRPILSLEREMRPATVDDALEVWLRLDWHDWRNPGHADHARNDWPEAQRRALAAAAAASRDDGLVCRVLADQTYHAGVFGQGLAQSSAPDYLDGWNRLRRACADRQASALNSSVLTGYLHEVHSKDPALAEILLDQTVSDSAVKPAAIRICASVGKTDDRALDRILTLLRDPEVDAMQRQGLWALRLDEAVSPGRSAELIDALAGCGEIDQAIQLLWFRDKDEDWSPALQGAARTVLLRADVVRERESQRGDWDRKLGRVAERALVGPEGEACAVQLLEAITGIGEETAWSRRGLPELLTKAIFTTQPRAALDAFLPCLLDDRRYALHPIINEHDDDDRPARGVFNRISPPLLRDWLNEDPAIRGRLLARYGSLYQRGDERSLEWTPLALMLFNTGDPETLDMIANRFDSGMSTGGWADRYRRRRACMEALQNHGHPEVRAWSSRMMVVIDDQIRAKHSWDRRPPERFE